MLRVKSRNFDKKWKGFFLKEIFTTIQRGKQIPSKEHIDGTIPYVFSKSTNNGIETFIGNKSKVRIFSNCITIRNGENVGGVFFHPYKFIASGSLTSLKNLTFRKYEYIFFTVQIYKQRRNYHHNFHLNLNDKRITRTKILLPTDIQGNPDYKFCKSFVQRLFQEKIQKVCNLFKKKLSILDYKKIVPLQEKKWASFFIKDIVNIYSGKDITTDNRKKGLTPYVSASLKNNGISNFIDSKNLITDKNCLSVNSDGSVGYVFYHQYEALFSRHCRKLKIKKKIYQNTFAGHFLANQITRQKDQYTFWYTMGTNRIRKQKIVLPVDNEEKVDYEYMDQYIKNIMYKKLQKYLDCVFSIFPHQ